MGLKVRKSVNQPVNLSLDEQALEIAQLALDIFIDKKHVGVVKSGQKNANQIKKK